MRYRASERPVSSKSAQSAALPDDALPDVSTIAAPHDPAAAPSQLAPLLTELASIWQDYRSNVWRTPLLQRMRTRQLQITDYLRWMSHWIPQVREGSLWMREGAASLTGDYATLASLIDLHAGEEQNDFKILHSDYLKAGGTETDINRLRRNPGGEALNAYLHSLAATPNPIGLLGAIYIIEGTGQRIVPSLLPCCARACRCRPMPSAFSNTTVPTTRTTWSAGCWPCRWRWSWTAKARPSRPYCRPHATRPPCT
jgi:3-oxoacyl-[acyl-carrier-protein] synthase-3